MLKSTTAENGFDSLGMGFHLLTGGTLIISRLNIYEQNAKDILQYLAIHKVKKLFFANCNLFTDIEIKDLLLGADLCFFNCISLKTHKIVICEATDINTLAVNQCNFENTSLICFGKINNWSETVSGGSSLNSIEIMESAYFKKLSIYLHNLKHLKIKGEVGSLGLICRKDDCEVNIDPTARIETFSIANSIKSIFVRSFPTTCYIGCKADSVVFSEPNLEDKNKRIFINGEKEISRLSFQFFENNSPKVEIKAAHRASIGHFRCDATDISQFTFIDCDLTKTTVEFLRLVRTTGVICSNVLWPKNLSPVFDTSNTLKSNVNRRLEQFYKGFKSSYSENGSVDDKLNFSYKEKNCILKYKGYTVLELFIYLSHLHLLPFLKKYKVIPLIHSEYKGTDNKLGKLITNLGDFFLLFFSFIISRHSNSIIQPLLWIAFSPIIIVGSSVLFNLGNISVFDPLFFDDVYPLLLDPTHKIPSKTGEYNYASELTLLQSLASKVSISVCLYHLVKVFRKYHE